MYWPLDAHHGTDYLDLPVLRRITEALVQGVDLHAVSLAQHFPEEGWSEAEPLTFGLCPLPPASALSSVSSLACSC